jgi:hypothetical protein
VSPGQVCALLTSLEEDGVEELMAASPMLGDDPRRSSRDSRAHFNSALVHLQRVAHLHALLCAHPPAS